MHCFRTRKMIVDEQVAEMNMEAKRRCVPVSRLKLMKEYGIEPWTFVQNLGDTVFIPTLCPHQVRNLKSYTKIAIDIISPENVVECFRLTEEFPRLPQYHKAKEDKLEVKKTIVHDVDFVVRSI
ncbi:hypothetical protein Ddye_000341 [Dipteronia dyeriana]|uniref:JmjC domain-containing protein n=1 Tax=Dipteronia dyeriana TaxID=168575 RepID=A0AAE0CSG1_9ROSI|nr:hypothetical protein Ddye_000341 [Dipteronia dyeriana]